MYWAVRVPWELMGRLGMLKKLWMMVYSLSLMFVVVVLLVFLNHVLMLQAGVVSYSGRNSFVSNESLNHQSQLSTNSYPNWLIVHFEADLGSQFFANPNSP